ncbi:MAG: MvdC family ATP-grasp ribosomal peptide maturase [Pseudomonadota bacterium]|nr:MvdC family ATP-grasp ribosomal peptide maturase [Pseudomonadota bacterium]
MPPTVLLVTGSGDTFNVDRVAAALAHRGARAVRLDTDRFPAELSLRLELGAGGPRRRFGGALAELDEDAVVGVWRRRFWPADLPADLDWRDGCVRESAVFLSGFLHGFNRAKLVNDPAAERRAEDKLLQLRLAVQAGLRVPRTLVTNEPDAVRAFVAAEGGRAVTKMLTALTQSMAGDTPFVHTSRVGPEDLAELDGLRYCPMVFQEEIPRARELRVAWVEGRCFAGALRTGGTGLSDWRVGTGLAWEPAAVPESIAARLDAVMAGLSLSFGAVDLIETEAGELVFLEVNPAGEWGMLERDLGLPISEALADALLGGLS